MTRFLSLIAALLASLATPLQAQTFLDDFEDGQRDANWFGPDPTDGTSGQLIEQNGRVEFVSQLKEGEVEAGAFQEFGYHPSYSEAWQMQIEASVDKGLFSLADQTGSMAIEVGNLADDDHYIGFGYGAGVPKGESLPLAVLFDDADNGEPNLHFLELSSVAAIRMTYDPLLHIVRLYHDLDTSQPDPTWTLLKAYGIDGVSNDLADEPLDWMMTEVNSFYLGIDGHSEFMAIPSGGAWADDFEFHLGSTVRNEPGVGIFDDFNDDSRDPIWSEPVGLQGPNAILVETSHRLEFQLAEPAARNDILQSIESDLAPRFDQAWEVKVETRFAPGGWSTEGEGGSLAIQIEPAGESFSRIRLVRGAFHDGAQLHPVIVVNGEEQEVEFQFPAEIEPSVLPDIVGLRVAWDPGSKILSSYIDTDGDTTLESWTLFSTFALDGSDQGADGSIDFQMQPTDTFRISLLAGADADDGPGNPVVEPGEAYFDNFTLIGESPATGYDLWAAQIPDEANRGPEDYFSGYPLPNVLRYMYGLDPTEDDPSVDLKIELQDGVPVLLHGLNESAQDYDFAYQWKANLTDPWTWASEDDATSVETVSTGGKTYRKITFPLEQEGRFVRLGVAPR